MFMENNNGHTKEPPTTGVTIFRRRPYLLIGHRCAAHTQLLKFYAERGETPEQTMHRVQDAYADTEHTPDLLGAFAY